MRSFPNVDSWLNATGQPIPILTPNKWIRGPFFFQFDLPAVAADTNLLTTAILGSDPLFASYYGTTAVPEALMFIQGIEMLTADSGFRVDTPARKAAVVEGTELQATVGNQVTRFPLGFTLRELWAANGASATAEWQSVAGDGPYWLPNGGIVVDLQNDQLIVPNVGTALAAASTMTLKLYGAVVPRNAPRDPELAGACSGLGDGYPVDVGVNKVLARAQIMPGIENKGRIRG